MNVAAYLRVSSKAQDHATQRATIERAAAGRGDTVIEWYSEKRGGGRLRRPELDRFREDIRQGRWKRVYTFKLDRLTRTGVRDTFEVTDQITTRDGCELVAPVDNLHLRPGVQDIFTEVMLFALGLAARLERASINDRIAEARERVEGEGGRWGRPAGVGLEALAKARALRAAGRSVRSVAMALGIKKSALQRALSRKDGVPEPTATPHPGAAREGAAR